MAQPYLSQLQEIANDVGLGEGELVCRHFFSGAALYARGKIIASLSPNGLAFKLSHARCDEVLSEGIAVPMCYFRKSPAKRGYVLFEDVDQLSKDDIRRYLQECIATSRRNAA
jgi:TfoX/Sxy family transcriptional regulator of competence genes